MLNFYHINNSKDNDVAQENIFVTIFDKIKNI